MKETSIKVQISRSDLIENDNIKEILYAKVKDKIKKDTFKIKSAVQAPDIELNGLTFYCLIDEW